MRQIKQFFTLLAVLFTVNSFNAFHAQSQNGVQDWVQLTQTQTEFRHITLFDANTVQAHTDSVFGDVQQMNLYPNILSSLLTSNPHAVELVIPMAGKNPIVLQLAEVSLTTPDISTGTKDHAGDHPFSYKGGVHFRGIVKGSNNSIATLSVFENDVSVMFGTDEGNFTIGKIEDGMENYILYNSSKANYHPAMNCFTDEGGFNYVEPKKVRGIGCKVVKVYFECDYKMYTDKGSNATNVVNYVTALYNQVAALYANENIETQISSVYVWTVTDPYVSLTNASAILTPFRSNNSPLTKGNLAHFLSTRNLGGGVSYLTTLCSSSYAFSVSMVYNTYNTVPTYSWSVEVITHEMGHSLGSPHTHNCSWAGGAIDNCGPTAGYTEGSCSNGPAPVNGGTIMSYCHLIGGIGINFNNGFGPLPGNLIRSNVLNASCLATTGVVPVGLVSSTVTTSSATLSWTSVPGALQYIIQYRPSTTGTWTTAGAVSTASISLSGLAASTTYFWHVKTDCSANSTDASFVTSASSSCSAPVSLNASNITTSSATVSWGAVTGAASYTIEYRKTAISTWTSAGTVSATSFSLSGLTDATNYSWQVKANCSGFSTTVTFTTNAITVCNPPANLSSTGITASSATLTWSAVSGATSYSIEYRPSTTSSWTSAGSVTTTSISLTGLTSATNYSWHVKTNCSVNSSDATFTTGSVTSCNPPINLTSSSITVSAAIVSWSAVSGATSYSIEYRPSTTSSWTSAGSVTTTSISLAGLTSATNYFWHVKTNCSVNSSDATFTTGSVTSCNPPINLTSSSITTSTAIVSWSAVSGATSYSMQYRASNSGTWSNGGTFTGTSVSFSGLAHGTTYFWHVKTNCSANSADVTFTTGASSCSRPNGLNTSAIINTSAVFSWNVKAGALNYTVQYRLSNSNTWITYITTPGTSVIITGLSGGSTYNWRVKANCSNYSSKTTFSTPGALIAMEAAKVEWNVYPNPANDQVTVTWNEELTFPVHIMLCDITGRVVLNMNFNEGTQATLPVESLSSGVYIVMLKDEAGFVKTRKLVKE